MERFDRLDGDGKREATVIFQFLRCSCREGGWDREGLCNGTSVATRRTIGSTGLDLHCSIISYLACRKLKRFRSNDWTGRSRESKGRENNRRANLSIVLQST